MSDLLLGRWLRGEASERGLTVSDSEVTNRLEEIIEQEFGGQKDFERYLKQAGFTAEEARVQSRARAAGRAAPDRGDP